MSPVSLTPSLPLAAHPFRELAGPVKPPNLATSETHTSADLLTCPHCRFCIRPRARFLAPDYCPRCIAQRRVAERLHWVRELDA